MAAAHGPASVASFLLRPRCGLFWMPARTGTKFQRAPIAWCAVSLGGSAQGLFCCLLAPVKLEGAATALAPEAPSCLLVYIGLGFAFSVARRVHVRCCCSDGRGSQTKAPLRPSRRKLGNYKSKPALSACTFSAFTLLLETCEHLRRQSGCQRLAKPASR